MFTKTIINEFFPPDGALAVPNADEIRPVLAKITEMAKEDNILQEYLI